MRARGGPWWYCSPRADPQPRYPSAFFWSLGRRRPTLPSVLELLAVQGCLHPPVTVYEGLGKPLGRLSGVVRRGVSVPADHVLDTATGLAVCDKAFYQVLKRLVLGFPPSVRGWWSTRLLYRRQVLAASWLQGRC